MTKHIAKPKGKRVSYTVDQVLNSPDIHLLMDKAEKLIGRMGWAYDEFDREQLLYKTVLYLHSIEPLLQKTRQFPCYVVHNADDDSRFESGSNEVVFRHYKRLAAAGYRVAMFHWPDKLHQATLYKNADYPYSKDHGPREG